MDFVNAINKNQKSNKIVLVHGKLCTGICIENVKSGAH